MADEGVGLRERRGGPITLACVTGTPATGSVLRDALALLFPDATVVAVDGSAEGTIPSGVHCAIVAEGAGSTQPLDVLRRSRAGGYEGPAVLVVAERSRVGEDLAASAARLGARSVTIDGDFPGSLGSAVSEALLADDGGGDDAPSAAAVRALRHTRRLIAAGELALDIRHDLNNPLAALLAEAQLLELEPLAPDHRESVRRIISLIRRVVGVVRELDGVGRA